MCIIEHYHKEREINMGTNIRIYLEEKMGDTWRDRNLYSLRSSDENTFSPVSVYNGRDYLLFSLLAGVRNFEALTPISAPRSLPLDCSLLIRALAPKELVDDIYHGYSWLGLKELFDVLATKKSVLYPHEKTPMSRAVESVESLIGEIANQLYKLERIYDERDLKEKSEDFRIVFWFED
jgi:hypothetical protein